MANTTLKCHQKKIHGQFRRKRGCTFAGRKINSCKQTTEARKHYSPKKH